MFMQRAYVFMRTNTQTHALSFTLLNGLRRLLACIGMPRFFWLVKFEYSRYLECPDLLQHTATHCNTNLEYESYLEYVSICSSTACVPRRIHMCHDLLQHTATHCNTYLEYESIYSFTTHLQRKFLCMCSCIPTAFSEYLCK